tara:strand:+ start:184 stop:441 length:258 start_codon:yes stop_codon:yes gene_type:complete
MTSKDFIDATKDMLEDFRDATTDREGVFNMQNYEQMVKSLTEDEVYNINFMDVEHILNQHFKRHFSNLHIDELRVIFNTRFGDIN